MKNNVFRAWLLLGLVFVQAMADFVATPAAAQIPPLAPVPISPEAQRQAANNVRVRVTWLKNSARTAPSYATGGDEYVWRSFEALRVEFATFTRSLTPQQSAYAANDLAELSAGLDILQEAFVNYRQDVASGRQPWQALREMCQVLSKGLDVWVQEFNKDCSRLRVAR